MAAACAAATTTTTSFVNFNRTSNIPTRLPLDRQIPAESLGRRGAISFGSCTVQHSKPRLQRRGAISYDKTDKNAKYVRMLGDVRMKKEEDTLHEHIKSKLPANDRKIIHSLAQPNYKTKCGLKFLTVSGMKRHRRSLFKPTHEEDGLIDQTYKSQAKCLLSKTSKWSFDVFSLDEYSNGRSLFHIVLSLFQEHNLIKHFNLDIVKLMKFATLVEEGYLNNPYHNAIHAADVTQVMHCYIQQAKLAEHITPIEKMVALVSAITHDLGHPGVNQAFLIATSNYLASLYNNNAVLENHHWRSAVGLIIESGLFDHLPKDEWESIVSQMKSLILATDMTRQQEFYTSLIKHTNDDDLDLSLPEDRHFILQIALKCADISNPCRRWNVCKKWSERVCDEFFQQGDYERKLSLKVTSLCDRFETTVPKIQTDFIIHVVEPLFSEFERFMPCDVLSEQLNNLRENRVRWQNMLISARPVTIDVNSNVMPSKDCMSEGESPMSSDVPSSPSSFSSEPDEMKDLNDIHSDIEAVADRLDWTRDNRRHSLPLSTNSASLYTRRESFPSGDNRRGSLPHTGVYQYLSNDGLIEKFALTFDNLLAEPRLSTLSQSVEASYILTGKIISK